MSTETAAREALERNSVWYHTLELAPGLITPGQIDLRKVAAKVLPGDLSGRRALDVGTFDGFWAFELERRGAEVVAIDVDQASAAEWSPAHREELERVVEVELGLGFRLAADALGSRARRVVCDLYDLTPEAIGGPVDLAFIGALLLHLRDPVRGLERAFEAIVPGGELRLLETLSLGDTLRRPRTPLARFEALDLPFNWWRPNVAALRRWVRIAGFTDLRTAGLHHPPQRRPMNDWYMGLVARRPG